MSEIFATIRLLLLIGGVLMLALLILLSLPNSRLKEIVMPFVLWSVTALSVAYIASPIDLVPEMFLGPIGVADDLVALVVAVTSARSAMTAGKAAKHLH